MTNKVKDWAEASEENIKTGNIQEIAESLNERFGSLVEATTLALEFAVRKEDVVLAHWLRTALAKINTAKKSELDTLLPPYDMIRRANQIKDVHTEHCCKEHGCKYGEDDCPVVTGKKIQSYPCEICSN